MLVNMYNMYDVKWTSITEVINTTVIEPTLIGYKGKPLFMSSLALGLVWNRENTAAAGWGSGVLVRAFLDGGPDGSCWAVSVWCWWTPPLCKHSSKCALILSGPKSPAQTGHVTVTLSDTFSAIVALDPRVYPHVVKERSSESLWRGEL